MTPPERIPKSRRTTRGPRLTAGIAAAVAISMLPLSVGSAEAARQQDGKSLQQLQREREQVRQEKASKASQVDALKASDAEVTAALSALSTNVSAQQDRVEEAERAVSQATSEQQAAEAAQAQKQQELDSITEQMKTSAVEAYVTAGSGDAFATIGSDDINDAVNKRTLLSMRAGKDQGLVEQFRSIQEDLEIQRAAAQAAAEKARAKEAEVESRLQELNAAYSEQQQFAAQVEQRLDSALAEADSLASLDAGLSKSISDKQAEIARAVAAERAAREARAKASASRAAAVVGSSSGSGGGGSVPSITGSGEIVTVGGIRIHQSIAGNLQRLLAAASASGIGLSGGGYRDPAGQIAVRRNNCGTSNYAIYEMPASSCSPPTARPGTSMHERGLAIDFTQGGSTLTRGSSAFAWLKANASSYGFFNLPSEPWHWSTNGN